MMMPSVKISDFATVVTGGTPNTRVKEYWNDGTIPWLPSGVCQNCCVERADVFITQLGLDNSAAKLMPPNTVLIALTGATAGKVGFLKFEASANQSVTGILPSDRHDSLYLFYFLQARRRKTLDDCYGGAQAHISQGYVKNIRIPLPPLPEQRRIAGVLDKIGELKRNAEARLQKLDLLVKARFNEMFGDVVTNPKGWARKKICEFAIVRIGPFGSLLHREDYVSGGHPLVNPSHMSNGKVVVDNNLTLTNKKYDELSNYHLQIGDIVVARRGEIGRCALIETDGLFCGTGSMYVRVQSDCRADYLQRVISYPSFVEMLESHAIGSTMKNINAGVIESSVIPLPPLSLQRAFAAFVEKVEALKAGAQKEIAQVDLLYRAKLQEYFG